MFGSNKLKQIKDQGRVVFKSRFLKDLSPLERYEFIQLCHRREYKENEYIYYQGDPGTGMYFIEEGKIQLIAKPDDPDAPESEILTHTMEPPESFGALSIGYELKRMSSAKCLTDCTLLGFFKPDFETLRNRHPQVAVKFMEALSLIAMKQLEKTTKALIEAKGTARAFAIQFETYYSNHTDE